MRTVLLAAVAFFLSFASISQPTLSFQPVVTGLSSPVDAVEVNDGSHRLFIVERTGKIKIWKGTLSSTPFLDVSSLITSAGTEQGLLSLAFHPNYTSNGYFFVYYTNTSGAVTLKRYTRATDSTANPNSGVVLMTIAKRYNNHNGGKLLFGTDGNLYFGTGDGGGGGDADNNAQNDTVLLGKMLRINVNNPNPPYYSIPSTNPYATSTVNKKEIIANGLRNPWRWSFDKQAGDMWIADVGQNAWEEVNVVPASAILNRNYGWSCYEGTHVFKACTPTGNIVTPIFDYPHDPATGGYSITGGYVYRGAEFPSLNGYYIFADYVTGAGWLTKTNGAGGWTTVKQSGWANHLSSFCETANGTLYAVSLDGTIYKIITGAPLPVRLSTFTGEEAGAKFKLRWQVENEEKGDMYIIEKSKQNFGKFDELTTIKAGSDNSTNTYSFQTDLEPGTTYYRIKLLSHSGVAYYSQLISHTKKDKQLLQAFKLGDNLRLVLPANTSSVEVTDVAGRILLRRNNIASNSVDLSISQGFSGVILIRSRVNDEWQTLKTTY